MFVWVICMMNKSMNMKNKSREYNYFMDELQDYLTEKDKKFMAWMQKIGKAQANIVHARDKIIKTLTELSPDSVVRPEVARAISNELNSIVGMLEIE